MQGLASPQFAQGRVPCLFFRLHSRAPGSFFPGSASYVTVSVSPDSSLVSSGRIIVPFSVRRSGRMGFRTSVAMWGQVTVLTSGQESGMVSGQTWGRSTAWTWDSICPGLSVMMTGQMSPGATPGVGVSRR